MYTQIIGIKADFKRNLEDLKNRRSNLVYIINENIQKDLIVVDAKYIINEYGNKIDLTILKRLFCFWYLSEDSIKDIDRKGFKLIDMSDCFIQIEKALCDTHKCSSDQIPFPLF